MDSARCSGPYEKTPPALGTNRIPGFAELRNFIPRGDLALPDFCGFFKNSKFKMADGQEKHESKQVPYEEIFDNINSENLQNLSKKKLQSFCNVLKLKVSSEKKELVQRLEPLGKCKQLFDKKVTRIQEDYCT